MTNKEIEYVAKRIIEMLDLKKTKGFYHTSWGRKTDIGLKASIFNIIADSQKGVESDLPHTQANP